MVGNYIKGIVSNLCLKMYLDGYLNISCSKLLVLKVYEVRCKLVGRIKFKLLYATRIQESSLNVFLPVN